MTGTILSVIILLAFWSLISFLIPIFVPTPLATFKSMYTLIVQGQLLSYTLITIYRILVGWIIGVVIGITTGWLIGQSSLFKKIVDPYTNFFRFIPPIIWVTMFIIWFGYTELMRFSLVAYATLVICVIHGTAGMVSIPEEKIRAALNVGVKGWELFWKVKIPAALPEAFIGMRVGMSNSFMTIVAVEMLTASSGLGYLSWVSKMYFRLDYVFCSIIILGLAGLIIDAIFKKVFGKILFRYDVKF
ncbi:MAG: hypothetical protein A2Z35_00110 [Actinobacteria bacterium RBG_19FT_COMBO_36_27]|nr:MAG: hypothetical protein A2Z35_00110 [Actinobacteria bacterium RBG_19FT_COMBO_36_27]